MLSRADPPKAAPQEREVKVALCVTKNEHRLSGFHHPWPSPGDRFDDVGRGYRSNRVSDGAHA